MWLSPVLLLLSFTGCLSIQGPALVRGPEQGSVTVRCGYSSRWQTNRKWWCRGANWSTCRILIRSTGSEKETKVGRFSIRDNHKNNSFQVTMEMLRQNDTDTYWCGIEKFGTDRGTRIRVTVYSVGKDTMSTSKQLSSSTMDSSEDMVSSDLQKRTHYMLLVFLKVPALVILAGVILWLKRSTQKVPEEQWRHTLGSDLDSELLAKDISP
ncbi:CMRF35-like molecule 7 [Apodemus sylvaticus]|uniref:CMRF35-like molecule 7 n=1 Tax=Apodemus sylvaticus TaxID=10129 RepID=UPI002241DB06|nr:CMRF35-like molecule 7 [Apodemus sylvaticus]